MNTRNSLVRVVVAVFVWGWSCSVLAGPVHIYGNDDFALPIPASDAPESSKGRGKMKDAVIEVTDHYIIHDLDVLIDLKHTKSFDLQIFLQSPAGTRICLNVYDDPLHDYFDGEDYTQTIFDDEAELAIEDAAAPFTGRFKPKDGYKLDAFDGEDIYGSWRLQIYDVYYSDVGKLKTFKLMVNVPEPATFILLTLAAGLAGSLKSRRRP